MIGINGNDPVFGFGGIKKSQNSKQKANVNNDVPIGKPQDVKETGKIGKDYGFELLEQGFYPGLSLNAQTQKPLNESTLKGLNSYNQNEFMGALNNLSGIEPENDLLSYAMSNIKGVDPDKLNRHMQHSLDDATASRLEEYMSALA